MIPSLPGHLVSPECLGYHPHPVSRQCPVCEESAQCIHRVTESLCWSVRALCSWIYIHSSIQFVSLVFRACQYFPVLLSSPSLRQAHQNPAYVWEGGRGGGGGGAEEGEGGETQYCDYIITCVHYECGNIMIMSSEILQRLTGSPGCPFLPGGPTTP